MIDLMTPDEVADLLKIERRLFVRTVSKQPGFPTPVKLSPRIRRWRREDIADWAHRTARR